jgi:hypothetical protein
MSRLDQLVKSYRNHAAIPLKQSVTVAERTWFVVYSPDEERRLRSRLAEFEIATKDSGLLWREIDLTGTFARWLDSFDDPEEREASLAAPSIVENYADPGFIDYLASIIRQAVAEVPASEIERTVFAITGLMELYDFIHVSQVMDALSKDVRGVLLIFFPGEREENTYRFLGARTGWDYLATPITSDS